MKTHHAILLNLLCVFLIFINPITVQAETSPATQAETTLPPTPAKKHKTHKAKIKKITTVENISTATTPKTLDLSVSFTEPQQTDADDNQDQAQSLFGQGQKKQPVQLSGNVLMSAEPEAEKKRSVEGAGIFINLKQ